MWDFIKLVKTMEDYSNQKYSRRMSVNPVSNSRGVAKDRKNSDTRSV